MIFVKFTLFFFCFFLQSTVPSDKPKITVEIQETLASLSKDDLKLFHFRLQDYTKSMQKPIPKSKLEDKDTIDTATLLTRHYGSEEALQVTKDILRDINQRELVRQLEKKTGKITNANTYSTCFLYLLTHPNPFS